MPVDEISPTMLTGCVDRNRVYCALGDWVFEANYFFCRRGVDCPTVRNRYTVVD